ncbi:MAG: hypothetical protein AAB224_02195 [Gemmatimonadota bacterium]
MVTGKRRGVGQIGCLVMLLLIAAVGYFAVGIGQVYWDYFQYRDRMAQEARFAASRTDGVIKKRLYLFADSLGLPEGAKQIRVRRRAKHVYIWTEYYENIELPFYTREILLAPRVEWAY